MPVTLQMVRFTTTEEQVSEVEAAVASMMAAIDEARPAGTRYAATKLADGVTFLLFLELAEGVENPLPAIPAARAFQQQMATWAVEPPAPQPVTVLGSYALFGDGTMPADGRADSRAGGR
jgi:hypothetical protein